MNQQISWAEIAKKGANKPIPVLPKVVKPTFIKKKKKAKPMIEKKEPQHKCNKCHDTVPVSEIEQHLNIKHKPKKNNFGYIVCPKCFFYLYTEMTFDSEEKIMKTHRREKHFMKYEPQPYQKNITPMISKYQNYDEKQKYDVDQLLKDTGMEINET